MNQDPRRTVDVEQFKVSMRSARLDDVGIETAEGKVFVEAFNAALDLGVRYLDSATYKTADDFEEKLKDYNEKVKQAIFGCGHG